jgi:Cu(I)-responsive transcriptional regulator
MNIGEAARAAGVSAKMIRHYEQIGLIPAADRTDAGYRQYGPRDVAVLRFVRQARLLGFSMEQIGGLIALWSDGTRASRQVKALAQAHLDDLERKLRELAEMKAALEALVARCHGDDHADCAILTGLAGPGAAPVGPPGARAARTRHRAEPASTTAVAGLMAWTQGLRAGGEGGQH